jgi:hypothetical protein
MQETQWQSSQFSGRIAPDSQGQHQRALLDSAEPEMMLDQMVRDTACQHLRGQRARCR